MYVKEEGPYGKGRGVKERMKMNQFRISRKSGVEIYNEGDPSEEQVSLSLSGDDVWYEICMIRHNIDKLSQGDPLLEESQSLIQEKDTGVVIRIILRIIRKLFTNYLPTLLQLVFLIGVNCLLFWLGFLPPFTDRFDQLLTQCGDI